MSVDPRAQRAANHLATIVVLAVLLLFSVVAGFTFLNYRDPDDATISYLSFVIGILILLGGLVFIVPRLWTALFGGAAPAPSTNPVYPIDGAGSTPPSPPTSEAEPPQ